MQVGMDSDQAQGASVFDLPKLEPKMLNERARVWVPDPDSIRLQYVHALGGKKAQQPGQPEPLWGGNWLCNGRDDVLKAANPSLDPEVCVLCREHQNGNPLVAKPTRKFITQVLRYATDPNGNLLVPFTPSLLVWQFSDKQYRGLVDIQRDWGNVRDRDLMLTCDNAAFKTWSLQPLPEVAFLRDQAWVDLVTQIVQSQAVPGDDLERILGRKASNDQEVLAKLAELAPAAMAPAMAYTPPAIPGTPPGMAPAPMMPQAPGMPMAPAGPPPMAPAPAAAYAQAPPAAQLYPPGGPFDQAQQVAPGMPPAMAQPPAPGMVPPPMPATPPPTAQAGPPLPQVPDLPQQQAAYAQQAAPAMPMPQAAPPAMAPPQYAPPPQAAPVPGVPDLTAPPPMVPPGAQAAPGAPAVPGAPTDLSALMQAPPPPAPPA